MNPPVGIRSLALSFPSVIRTNDYWSEKSPELVAQNKPRRTRTSKASQPTNSNNGLDIWSQEVAPYLPYPFRGSIERRVLAPNESSLTLEYQAAKEALDAAQLTPKEVDLAIVASLFPEHIGPGSAAYLARKLKLNCPAWNLESTCSSAIIALQNACALVKTQEYRNVLVVVSHIGSNSVDEEDTLSWSIGDGAGAFVVDSLQPNQGILGSKIVPTVATCDAYSYELMTDAQGQPRIRTRTGENASMLAETAVDCVRTCCEGAAAAAGVTFEQIDFFAFNTPTAWYASVCTRALGINPERTINLYPRYANIGPVFAIANLYHAAQAGKIRENDLVLVYTNGAAATAAATVMRWGDVALGSVPAPPISVTPEEESIQLAIKKEELPTGKTNSLSRKQLLAAKPGEQRQMLEAYLLECLASSLQLSINQFNSQQSLATWLDSLMAIVLRSRIETDLQLQVPMEKFFGETTVAQLVELLLNQLALAHLISSDSVADAYSAALPTIVPAPEQRYEPFPLTDMQHAFWVGRSGVIELGGVSNHGYYEIEGNDFNLERLNWALQELVKRHDMLRAVVLPDGQQRILEQVPAYPFEVLDLIGQEEAFVKAQLEAIRERMSHQVLPSDQWPLFDFRATCLDGGRVRLHISYDLLVFDAWSLFRLFEEWFQLYQNPEVALPPLELSFRDYALAEQGLRETELYVRSQNYWLSRIDTLPPAPDLPLAKSPHQLKQHRVKRYEGGIDGTHWQQLKQRAAQAGLTPSGVLLAAFAEIMTLWSNNPQFTLNLALFNRLPLHPQVNDILGDFTSVTLLAVDKSEAESFCDRAIRLQKQLWQDLEHRYFSGVLVTRELSRRKGAAPSAMPVIFTSTLGFGSLGQETRTFSHFGELVYGISQASQAWMDIQVWEEKGTLTFNWDVVEELFPEGLIEDMFEAYCCFLKQLATSESVWVETRRNLIPPAQLAQRNAINATEAPISDELLHTLFAAQVKARGNELAIISSERNLTYQELCDRSNQVGHKLRSLGATPNQLVAVVMEKGWEQIVAVMGILAAGAAYVPIDPNLPQERFLYLLENSQANIVLTQSCLDKKLSWSERVIRLCIDIEDFAQESKEPLQPIQTPDDLAYVIYTSGSTGLPKGVMITHRNVANVVVHTNNRFNVSSQDRILALTALNHDLSVYDIFGLLSAGGTIVIPDASGVKDPSYWAELMVREQVTLWNSVPAMMEMLVDYAESHSVALPESLRLAIMGGDWLPVSLPNRLKSLVPEVQILSIGGPTETTIWNIGYLIEKVDPNWKSIPYGQPMANAKYYILNEALEDCPVWVPGEMYCAGVQLAKGYWQDEEKTNAKFITHPRTGERLYRTGDLGRYLPDGNIEFLGRVDFQIKIRGYRIEAGEIEAALKQHPAVRSAVVTAVGEQQIKQRLIAYIVSETQQDSSPTLNLAEAYERLQLKGVLVEPVERIDFKLKQLGLRQLQPDRASIELPKLEFDEVLNQAYLRRQSYRQFLDKPIPLKQLSQFLSCLLQMKLEGSPLPKYRYASAGGLYPVQTYLYIKPNRVEGLEAGFYYYHPADHRLVSLTAAPEIQSSIYFEKNQPVFERAAFSLFLIGQLNAIAPMYGELSKDFCLLEAGYISQLLMDNAPEYEIGLCPIGALEFEQLRDSLQLESNQILLHSFVGGGIDLAWTKQWLQPTNQQQPNSLVDELRQFLRQKLPDYMMPSGYIVLDALPLTANGKVDRLALPAPEHLLQTRTYVMPQTKMEQFVAGIWQEILQLDRVSIHDNFFELGGDSLKAIQIISRLREIFQIQLPVQSLLEAPTLATLAESIDRLHQTTQKLQAPLRDALTNRVEVEI